MKKEIYIIAEVGQAHAGSITMAHSYIDALAQAGVDAIKFQMHIADAESSIHEDFRTTIPYHIGTRTDYWKTMEFTINDWSGLKVHCDNVGLDFIVSPFSVAAVDILRETGVSKFKIGSGEIDNYLMLDRIASTGKELVLSSGMSSWIELDDTVAFLRARNARFSILQCTTSYPTQPHQWGLNVISELQNRYQVPVGLSDHSGDIFACLAAAALGAKILEFHVIFDKRIESPDTSSSITIDQAKTMVTGIRHIEIALNSPIDKSNNEEFTRLKTLFGKSLSVNKQLPKGSQVRQEDLESKKPAGYGIPPRHYNEVLQKILTRDMQQWEFLAEIHLGNA